jgi:hypothetical protein
VTPSSLWFPEATGKLVSINEQLAISTWHLANRRLDEKKQEERRKKREAKPHHLRY